MKQHNDAKKSASRKSGLPKKIIKLLLFVLFFVFVLGAMYFVNNFSISNFTDFFSVDETVNPVENADDYYNYLHAGNKYEEYNIVHRLTPEELTLILSELTLAEEFELTAVTTNHFENTKTVERSVISFDGGVYDIKRFDNELLIESITCNGNEITFKDELRNRQTVYPSTENFSFEETCSLPSLDALTEICNKIINGESPTVDYNISLISSEEGSLYKVVFAYPDINQREEYYVSYDNRIIVGLLSYIGDVLYYEYEVTDFRAP